MENKTKTLKYNPAKLTPEQRDKLDTWNQNKQIITNLEDMASIFQEFLDVLDKSTESSDKNSKQMGSLLMDMREALNSMKAQKAPEMPDYAKPVVNAVSSLEKALTASIKAIDVKPDVKIEGTTVETNVDLSKVERILKTELPSAFKEAIKLIPKTEIPESDYTPLTKLMAEMSEKLDNINTGVRLKPAGVNAKITNTADITSGLATEAKQDDIITAIGGISGGADTPLSTYTYIQKDTSGATYKYYGYADANTAGGWAIKRITIATNLAEFVKGTSGYTTAWTNRASQSYADIWTTF